MPGLVTGGKQVAVKGLNIANWFDDLVASLKGDDHEWVWVEAHNEWEPV